MSTDKNALQQNLTRPAPENGEGIEARLLLICQSEGLRNRYSDLAGFGDGDDNSGLTALGWEQTNLLAQWLKGHESIDVLVSGPQLRSRLTAQRIGQFLGLPVKVRFDMPRYSFDAAAKGHITGDVPRQLAELGDHSETTLDSDYQLFADGVVAVMDQVLSEHWGKTVALVAGGTAVAALIRQFFGAHQLPICTSHSGITEFVRSNGRWWLCYVNRREHLPVPLGNGSAAISASSAEQSSLDPEELSRISEVYSRVGSRLLTGQPAIDRTGRLRDLLRFAHLPADARILDVGTGDGQLALLLAEDGAREVVGVDINPVMLESAEYLRLSRPTVTSTKVSYRLAPAQALPFSDDWFDVVVCRMVLHHARKPERIMQELVRVLKPGGILLIADLLGADDPVRRATQNAIEERRNPAYVAARTAEQYRKLVQNAGLTLEAEKVSTFERELEDWLADMEVDASNRAVVRDMLEAGIETDASGLHVRRQGMKIYFDQRFMYIKAIKKA